MSEATQIVGMFFPIYYSTSSIQMIFNGVPLTEITIWINLGFLAVSCIVFPELNVTIQLKLILQLGENSIHSLAKLKSSEKQ